MDRSRLAHESFWGTIITYVGVALGFFTTFFVLTNYLTPEEVGLTRLLFEVATLLSGFCLLGLSTSIGRYYPYFRESMSAGGGDHGFWRCVCQVALVGCAVSLPLYYVFHRQIIGLFARNSALLVEYYYLVIPLSFCIVFWTIAELYSIQRLHLAIPRAIRELVLRVLLLGAYLLYAFSSLSQQGFLWVFVGCYAVCMVLSLVYLARVSPLSWQVDRTIVTPELRHNFGRYTLLALLSTVGTTLAGRMDIFMLALVDKQGLVSAAVFSIAFFMVSIMEIPTRATISIATPYLSDAMKRRDYVEARMVYQRISFYQLLSASIIFVVLWCNMDNIFAIMPGGADYVGAREIFFVLGLSKLVEVLFTGSHPIVHGSTSYHWNLYYTLLLVVVSFLCNLYLIPRSGPVGAACSTLLTCVLGYALQQGLLYRRLGIHPWTKRLLLVLPVVALMLLLDSLLPMLGGHYADMVVRSAVVSVPAVLLVLYSGLAPELRSFVLEQIVRLKRYACPTGKY